MIPKLLFIFVLSLHSCKQDDKKAEYVYICKSEAAVAYHKSASACKGIRACTHQIAKVTKDDAIRKYKYRACKLCY